MPEWEAFDLVPTEAIGDPCNYDRGHRLYGMYRWRDLFSPRQLLCHGTSVEVFRELLREEEAKGALSDVTRAALAYLSLATSKTIYYGCRLCRWDTTTSRVRSLFDRHDFAFVWSYAEMAALIVGLGYDWALHATGKALEELIELTRPDIDVKATIKTARQRTIAPAVSFYAPLVTITAGSGDELDHLDDKSVDLVVMDPPYADNVMYAELSDFFYVWQKRMSGYLYPELFRRQLTDKENEAVANVAKFKGKKGARDLALADYNHRMAAIFAECRRVLKPDGLMTVMFTHKSADAWDALASGLLEAGFTISASWPINTEAAGSMHIRDKAAASSTIFLVCRPRPPRAAADAAAYWEDVEPRVAQAVRTRVAEFQAAGIAGVDLYLSCFGPALEELARHWPLKRGQPKRGASAGEDPYAVTPEDAIEAARREVKQWRMEQILQTTRRTDLDGATEWFVLAWDAFRAPEFPYDEALRLARVVGVDLDREIIGRMAEKKASSVVLWDSKKRAAKGALGAPDGSRGMIDALHHAAQRVHAAGLQAARELLERSGADKNPTFPIALAAILEVLPISSTFTRIPDEKGPIADAAGDFDALEHLRRLAYTERVCRPRQLGLWESTESQGWQDVGTVAGAPTE